MKQKYKCSKCGYYLPKEMFFNPYSKGFNKICNNCVHDAIHNYMQEIKKRGDIEINETIIDENENHIPFF